MYLFTCENDVWYCQELMKVGELEKRKEPKWLNWYMLKPGTERLRVFFDETADLADCAMKYLADKAEAEDGMVMVGKGVFVESLGDAPELRAPRCWNPDGEHEKELPQAWGDRLVGRRRELLATSSAIVKAATPDGWRTAMEARDQQILQNAQSAAQTQLKQQQEAEARTAHEAGTAFINPYSFVPLPQEVSRCAPRGHATASADGVSGFIDVSYEMLTPLLLPTDNASNETYSGSSIRGAIRSVHEVLTRSCLRIIDLDYVPAHREPISTIDREAKLAVVTKSDSGQATEIQETETPIWLPVADLRHALDINKPYDVTSGLRFDLFSDPESKFHKAKRRRELRGKLPRGTILASNTGIRAGQWVVIVSDEKARPKNRHYYVAIAKLVGGPIRVESDDWQDFQYLCQGTRDTQVFRQEEGSDAAPPAPRHGSPNWPGEVVRYSGKVVGRRRKATGVLGVGDVVWRTKSGSLKMAYVWRHKGVGPVRDRLGDQSLEPCTDPENLCPTCAVFGMIDNRDDSENRHDQASYASHLRFLVGHLFDEDGVGPAVTEDRQIALLRGPKPSSGNFYLEHSEGADLSYAGDQPKATWGSELDRGGNRRIAGRKFYRHGQVEGAPTVSNRQRQRQWYRNWQGEQSPDGQRKMAIAGSRLRFRVAFDNLSETQLAFLMIALDPRLLSKAVASKGQYANHLGGGKPLGFGTAVAEEVTITYSRTRDRYSGKEAETWNTSDTEDPFGIADQLQPLTEETWLQALCRLLDTESVDHDRIWYPFLADGVTLTKRNAKIDEAYAFFARFNGNSRRRGVNYPMRAAPPATAENQYIEASPSVEEN